MVCDLCVAIRTIKYELGTLDPMSVEDMPLQTPRTSGTSEGCGTRPACLLVLLIAPQHAAYSSGCELDNVG